MFCRLFSLSDIFVDTCLFNSVLQINVSDMSLVIIPELNLCANDCVHINVVY